MTSIPFNHLLAAYTPKAHRAALGFLGNEQDAREAAQQALMKALSAQSRYDRNRPFYPWLYRIVKNTCLDRIRRRNVRAIPGLESDRVPSKGRDPLQYMSQAEAIEAVQSAMAHLDPEQREIISLRHFQHLSYAEMTDILGIPAGTVMSRLYRARNALSKLLEHDYGTQ